MTITSTDALARTFPLGPLQEQIWRFWRQNPQSSGYIMPEVYFFDGDFDVEAAELALTETARRHESLRTTFHEADSGVVQLVSRDPAHVPVEVLDLRGMAASEQAERLESAVSAAANLPFDLSAQPAIRLTAILLSESRTGLVMAVHQIVCDGASIVTVLDDFGELYRAARRGTPPNLPPISPGYGTFVTEQLAALADGAFSDDSAYWAEWLAGSTGSRLPGDSHGVTGDPATLNTYALPTTLDTKLAEAVRAYARGARTTPFSVLLCAMSVMIAAATGDGDVSVGTATSSRTPRFARTVGMLTNMVVARSRIDLSGTFAAALEEVSLNLLDAIDHQDLPFSQVVNDLSVAGSQGGTDLIRTTFSAGTVGGLKLGEGSLSERVIRSSQGPFDLAVVCEITASGIALDWEYALRTYSRELARDYCGAYQEILATLLEVPDAAMSSLGLTEMVARVAPVHTERVDRQAFS